MSEKVIALYADRIVKPYNITQKNTSIDDNNGHGTAVILLSTANYDNISIYGLAPKSILMPVVVSDESGRTSAINIADGIRYAVDNGADIINISLGARIGSPIVEDAVNYAYENNVITVAAAGDDSRIAFLC